ncbi:hypothetical protein [Nocardia fluminea]|uniref:Uncharacterized protein n=1 Tax=Nocardia fluminea TaxID=134984 RepID=A0A2N3V559_9NOCA|nr:hypothetical protein [Nocardia fluminea]PKV76765.1 hypothetical protein ATK86_7168 [Nocardia fluminea]
MSKKKNTTDTAAETAVPAPERNSQSGPVPVLGNDTARALWAALRTHPDRTTAALAHIAGIGQSTARRLLAQWETAGCAQSRTESDSPRAPKIWNTGGGAPTTTEPDTAPAPADPAPAEPATPEPVTPGPVSDHVATSAEPQPIIPATEPAPAEPETPELVSAEPVTSVEADPVTPATAPDPEVASPGPDAPADPEPDTTAETALAAPTGDDSTDPAPDTPVPADATAAANAESTAERLPAGALRGQVEDYLRDNPGKEFTPHQIGKALERSSGAVHNALVKLTKDETARQTSTAPKKFTLAS